MNQTLLKTHKINCAWMNNVQLYEQSACKFNDQIAVHCIRIQDFEPHLETLELYLDENEMLKSVNFLMENDSKRFIIARAMLKILLGKYLQKHPADIEFYYEENLKPGVKHNGQPVHFNVSHSGDLIMIAIGNKALGVDIEMLDEGFPYDQVIDRTFTEEEIGFISKSHNPSEAFYLLWTRKEALMKATGKGIDHEIKGIPCLNGLHHVSMELTNSSEHWMLGSFGIGYNYVVSLSYQSESELDALKIYKTGAEVLIATNAHA